MYGILFASFVVCYVTLEILFVLYYYFDLTILPRKFWPVCRIYDYLHLCNFQRAYYARYATTTAQGQNLGAF